jgi:hypothetical protein
VAILQDPRRRAAYYAASQRFVSHLVALGGIAHFMRLYTSQAPEAAYAFVYGQTRQKLVQEAFRFACADSYPDAETRAERLGTLVNGQPAHRGLASSPQ